MSRRILPCNWRYAAYGLLVLLCMPGAGVTTAMAASAPAPTAEDASPYVPVTPSFITNYDGGGRLRYLKADVVLRTDEPAAAEAIRKHMPYIRNGLVILFSSQLEENLTSTDGKETLRLEALQMVRSAVDLLNGSGSGHIVDLYFTSFIIQQ